jgi:erythromycin esterase
MNYIKENNIKIVGIDNQISTKYNSEYLKTAINKYDKIAAEKIYCLDTTINALYFNKELFKDEPNETKSKFQKNKSELVKIFSEFNLKIDSLLRQKNYSNSQSSLLTLKKVIQNKIYLSQTYLNINKYGTQRDSIMTSNLKWIMDSLAPNKKIIVWAHNSHVSKTGMQNEKSYMGKLISNLLKNQVYSIGLYAYAGETMDVWRRNKIKIAKPSTNSIENKLHINDSESKATFINFSKIIDKNNLWTTEKIKAFSWGVRETFIVPSDEYDGAILINVATTPKYIN